MPEPGTAAKTSYESRSLDTVIFIDQTQDIFHVARGAAADSDDAPGLCDVEAWADQKGRHG